MDPKYIKKTSFCDKHVNNVTNDDMKKYILDNLKLKSNLNYNSRYSFQFNDRFINNLNNPHLFCLKTTGAPYLLFCTKIYDVNYSFLIDKKKKDGYDYPTIFIVNYRFSPDLYNGTLFETELLKIEENNWILLLSDIYIYKGNHFKTHTIIDRVNIIYDIILNEYIDDDFCNICPIQVKKYYDFCKLKEILSNITNFDYKIRGIYFIPLKPSYKKIFYLFTESEFSNYNYKKKKYNVFRIIKTNLPDVYELYIKNKENNLIKHGYADVPSLKLSRYLFNIDYNNDVNVECIYNSDNNKWQPINISDKEVSYISEIAI